MSIVSSLILSVRAALLSEGSRRSAASILARSSSAPGWTGLSAPALAFGSGANGLGAGVALLAPTADSGLSMSAGVVAVRGCGGVGVVGACCGIADRLGGFCAFFVPVSGFVTDG